MMMRLIGTFLLGFIAILFLVFGITDKPVVRRGDEGLYNLKYVRLRMLREDGWPHYRSTNAEAIDSSAAILRKVLSSTTERSP